MKEILAALEHKRAELKDCKLYRFMRDESIDARKRIAFAPQVAFFSMSFGDLMSTVLRRQDPQSVLDKLVNAHCSEDDYHWKWYLQDLHALGYDTQFSSASDTCIHLWSRESAPVRRLIYSVVQHAGRSPDPLFHLILIEILEAGLSGFFEYSYKAIAAQGGLNFLKYFGEVHYREEYAHTVTSWFQVDDMGGSASHPLTKFTPTDEVRKLALEAVDAVFARFFEMYDYWYDVAVRDGERPEAVVKERQATREAVLQA